MGGLTPDSVPRLRPYAKEGQLFAIVAGSAITRSDNPHATIDKFLNEIAKLPSLPTAQDTPPLVPQTPITPSLVSNENGILRRAAGIKQ
jgi:hypothetical protein